MTITITAFERSPDGGKGLARDTRVRWALEEVGQPYEVRLVSFAAMKEPAHLALHPFGQIPTYEEGDLGLFETGAIVFHIARAPCGPAAGRCQCPGARDHLDVRRAQHGGAADPRARDRQAVRGRQALGRRSACRSSRIASVTGWASFPRRLGDADWLDGAFSAGDLMMVSVLLRLRAIGHSGRISEPLRLCRPRRSAARLQARLRRATGGQHRQATDRLIDPVPRERRLFPCLHPVREGSRSFDQGGSVPQIQLAVEAETHDPSTSPPDHRRTAERSAVQYHCRSGRQDCRASQLRTAGR